MIKLQAFCSTKTTMVVISKTITYVGRRVYTRTGVKVLTDPTVTDSSRLTEGSELPLLAGMLVGAAESLDM